MNKQHLILILYIIQQFPGISDLDLNNLCLESLQIDFFELAPLKEKLLTDNLAQKLDPTNLFFLESTFGDDNKVIPVWLLTEEGKKLQQNLRLDLPSGSLLFLEKILANYKKNQKKIFSYVALIKKAKNQINSFLVLQVYKKDELFFSIQLPLDNIELAQNIQNKWHLQEEQEVDFPIFLQLCELNQNFLKLWLDN